MAGPFTHCDRRYRSQPTPAHRAGGPTVVGTRSTDYGHHKSVHINHLELLAIIKVFHAFLLLMRGRVVQLATDNTTALFYVNKQGGTHSPSLLYLAVDLWEWCYSNHVFPVAVHISTEDNTLTDRLSRLPT